VLFLHALLLEVLPADLTWTGGGIVFDSDPYEEWVETMNKLGANMQCISSAEKLYTRIQVNGNRGVEKSTADTEALSTKHVGSGAHIELAAG
jgi:anthranilate synthase component I